MGKRSESRPHRKGYTDGKIIIRELQNKTVRSHYIPTGGTTIQNTTTTCWQGCRTGTLVHRWWEGKMVQPHWKKDSWAVSYNAKHSLTKGPINSTSRHTLKGKGKRVA